MSLASAQSYAEITDAQTVAQNARGMITVRQAGLVRQVVAPQRGNLMIALAGGVVFLTIDAVSIANMWPMLASPAIRQPTVWAPMLLFAVIAGGVLSVMLLGALRAWHTLHVTSADLGAGQVACADGVVRWGRGPYGTQSYVARAGQRQLRGLAYPLQLPPGAYRCYYLPHSGWLLAAQPLAEPTTGSTTGVPRQAEAIEVMRAHGFSAADLLANRAGQLSPRQRVGALMGALGWLLLMLFLLGGVAILYWRSAPLAVSVILSLLAFFPAAQAWKLGVDARATQPVTTSSGVLQVRMQHAYRSVTIDYQLGGVAFELSNTMIRRQANASVIAGQTYRAYALRRSGILLSIEPLP
jgi:hypothetical protein